MLRYLKNKYSPQIVSATAENFSNLIQIAARFGQTVVVTDCDSGSIPFELVGYLRMGVEGYRVSQSTQQAGYDDEETIEFNDSLVRSPYTMQMPIQAGKTCEVSPDFKLIMISSVSVLVPSELQNSLIELSFAPTTRSRIDLYTERVLKSWSPETLEKLV